MMTILLQPRNRQQEVNMQDTIFSMSAVKQIKNSKGTFHMHRKNILIFACLGLNTMQVCQCWVKVIEDNYNKNLLPFFCFPS